MSETINKRRSKLLRILSLVMVLVIALSTTVLPVLAATSVNKTVSNSSGATCTVKTGKGWLYSLHLKSTTVTIRNTGKSTVTVTKVYPDGRYESLADIPGGQSRSVKLYGSDATYKFLFHKKTTTAYVTISTNAGSVS